MEIARSRVPDGGAMDWSMGPLRPGAMHFHATVLDTPIPPRRAGGSAGVPAARFYLSIANAATASSPVAAV
jgi:hypothetical protein